MTLTRYVAFGDSLTEGVVSPAPSLLMRLNALDAYPARLQMRLTERYTTQTPVVLNRGRSGETAEDAVPRFLDMVRSDRPEAVLLLEGVNDIAGQGQRGANAALAALDRMMKEARNRGVAVYVATLPPERPGAPKTVDRALLDRFDEDVRRLARGENATLVDLARDLDPATVGVDGLHLTEAGYDRVAELFFRQIAATRETPGTRTSTTRLPDTR